MSTAHTITLLLVEEGIAARAHFQVWWALRNLAIPEYLPVMNDGSYVDFFHASNSGHCKLFFLALSKVFDRDTRVAGISGLKRALRSEGHTHIALRIAREMKPIDSFVKKLTQLCLCWSDLTVATANRVLAGFTHPEKWGGTAPHGDSQSLVSPR